MPSKFAESLARRIRATRIERGLTLEQAASRTFGLISTQTWGAYEVARYKPRLNLFCVICLALECSPLDLLPAPVRHRIEGRPVGVQELTTLLES